MTGYQCVDEFFSYKKKDGVTMNKYITECTKRLRAVEKFVELPKYIAGIMLLRNAGLDENDRKLALTGVSYNEDDKEKVFDSMVASLLKFFGEQNVVVDNNCVLSPAVVVKSEPVLTAEEVAFTRRVGGKSWDTKGKSGANDRNRYDRKDGDGNRYDRKGKRGKSCSSPLDIIDTCVLEF